jgi:hypothetical protein
MLQVIGFTASALLITMAFMVIYFGLLSRFTNWLLRHHKERIRRLLRQPIPLHPINNIGDSGDDTRNEGGIIICYINCFEQGYHLLKTWIGRLRYSIGKLKVRKDGCYQNEQCHEEYRGYNVQKPLHKPILNRPRKGVNQSGKEPLELPINPPQQGKGI